MIKWASSFRKLYNGVISFRQHPCAGCGFRRFGKFRDRAGTDAHVRIPAENGKLPLSYDAVVSAVSKAVTEQEVLSIVFVLEWGGE